MSKQWAKDLPAVQSPLNLTAKPVKMFAKGMRNRVYLGKDGKKGGNTSHSDSV